MQAVILSGEFQNKPILGVSLLRRTLQTLSSVGVKEVVVGNRLPEIDGPFILIGGNYLIDPRIIKGCLDRFKQLQKSLICLEGKKWAGVAILGGKAAEEIENFSEEEIPSIIKNCNPQLVDTSELGFYVPKLRRGLPPYFLKIKREEDIKKAESLLVEACQKDPSDLVALVHRPIENWVCVRLAHLPITPNQVTILVNILAWVVTGLFAAGHLLAGSIISFFVGLMDGFDGKLARLKGLTTKTGSMEHSFDLLFEFSWILALGFYLQFNQTPGPGSLLLAGVIITLVAFYRNIYDRFGQLSGMSLDVFNSFQRQFRRIAGRRNLYNIHILAFVLMGSPWYALWSIAAHAALTALVYSGAALFYLWRMDRG